MMLEPNNFGSITHDMGETDLLKMQGDRLHRLRLTLGYRTQLDFALALGITEGRWGNFERGTHPLSRQVAEMIYKKFPEVTAQYLYSGETRGMTTEFLKALGELPTGNAGPLATRRGA